MAHPYDDICKLRRFGRLHAVSLWRFQSDQSVLGEYSRHIFHYYFYFLEYLWKFDFIFLNKIIIIFFFIEGLYLNKARN